MELLSDEKVIKLVSTTKFELALVEDHYGYFVAYTIDDETVYGQPFRDFFNASAVFNELYEQLTGN